MGGENFSQKCHPCFACDIDVVTEGAYKSMDGACM